MGVRTPIYLDHHATTPMDLAVLEVLQKVQQDHFGNASSDGHSFGWAAQTLVKNARVHVAQLIGAHENEIVFTSGATEANNLAILGRAAVYPRPQIIISTNLEHSSISAPLDHLQQQGWNVLRVKCNDDGLVSAADFQHLFEQNQDTEISLVSVTAAQNEIGTLQPLAEIAKICKAWGVLFHTDAAQACGHVALNFSSLGLDLMSISSHKIYGPKGVGALVVRRTHPPIALEALSFGGGQEGGLRPGTLNVPGIAAFGEACRIAHEVREEEVSRLVLLRQRFWHILQINLAEVHCNGSMDKRLPGNLNIRFDGITGRKLLRRVAVLAMSTGSACRSGEVGPSPVLQALGLDEQQADSSVRIGLGRFTTEEEVDFAAGRLVTAVEALRLENI